MNRKAHIRTIAAAAVDHAHERRCQGGEDDGLRHEQGLGRAAVPQAHGVEEIARAEGHSGDEYRAKRMPVDLLGLPAVEPAQKEPDGCKRQCEGNRHRGGDPLAQHRDREDRRDNEVEPEDRRVDAHRSGSKAAQEIVESDEDEETSQRAPCGRRADLQGAGRPGKEEDRRAEDPALHHQEMAGRGSGHRRALVDEVAQTIANQRGKGVLRSINHPSLMLPGRLMVVQFV